MSSRSVDPGRGTALLPPGLRVASIWSRIGAWLIDSLILGAFQLAFLGFTLFVGAIRISPEADRQLRASPLVLPTVPPYEVNLTQLALLSGVFVALNVAYATICWARFRGMPGQKLMSLQVGSASSGRNLGYGRAFARAVVALGIPLASLAAVVYGAFAFVSSVPWSEVMKPTVGGKGDAWQATWSGPLDLATLLILAWPAVLLIWTAASPTRQGLHDRVAGSLVVAKGAAPRTAGIRRPGGEPGFVQPGLGLTPGYPGYLAPPDQPGAPDGPESSGDGWRDPYGAEGSRARGAGDGAAWPLEVEGSDAVPARNEATVRRRVMAYLLDCVIVYLVFAVLETAIVMVFMPSATANLDERTYILLGLVGGVWQLAYFTIGWAVLRGTVGQRLRHLRVTDAATGKALGWMDAVVRWAILQGPFALATIVPEAVRLPVVLVAPVWALLLLYSTVNDPNGRGLHDRFLNSRVMPDPAPNNN